MNPRVLGSIFVLSVGLAGLGFAARADDPSTGPSAASAAPHSPSTVAHPTAAPKRSGAVRHSTTGKTKARATRRSRPLSYRRRMARLRPEPERIREIQRALAQAGYLHQEPTGAWDPATRDAMQRFQQEHGYPTTGLPEAKSLMKLGLGPHPLPEDTDPTVAARTSAGAPAPASAPADPSR